MSEFPSSISTEQAAVHAESKTRLASRILASPEELPNAPIPVVRTLFVLLQFMYLGFYVGALANLAEIGDLFTALPKATQWLTVLIVTAAILIPVRAFVLCAVFFHAPGIREKFLKFGPFCCHLMSYGRSRPSCCCTISTSVWHCRARPFSSTPPLLSAPGPDGRRQG